MSDQTVQLTRYLRKLRWALSPLPARDSDDIVAETRTHIEDRMEAGASAAEAINAIGDPRDYARRFVNEHAAETAMSTRGAGALVAALASNAAGNVLAVATLGAIFLVWAFVLLVCLVAVMKIFNPETVGLWYGGSIFFLGVIDDPSKARELLGVWIFPAAFTLAGGAVLLTRKLAGWALRLLIAADSRPMGAKG